MENIIVGGAWPYANGSLHIGHIAALLPGDVLARYFRANGKRVFYVSGSDCHGTPITIRAKQENSTPDVISDHYHNIDDDPNNEYIYNGHPFSVHRKTVNGVKYDMPADYKTIVRSEDWDYIIFYQGPNSAAVLGEEQYYSELASFTRAIRENMTSPESGKIVYYMTWAHNVEDTRALYESISRITRDIIARDENVDGIIPAATLIENLRISGFKGCKGGDITRDWGHLNYGLARYAMALLWYCYLTGNDVLDITFMPTLDDATDAEKSAVADGKASFTDVTKDNIEKIRAAVRAALDSYYETQKA